MINRIIKKIIKPLCLSLAVIIPFVTVVAVIVRVNKLSAVTDGNYDAEWKPSTLTNSNSTYELVSDNSNSALFVDRASGKFYLEDKLSNKKWYSSPQNIEEDTISKGILRQESQSEIILEYIYVADENSNATLRKANSKTSCTSENALDVEAIENGVKVTYDFKDLEIRVRVTYTLVDNVFHATVLANEIEDGTKSYLVSLNLLPYFGAAGSEDEGYLFVPDGSGAIVNFNNGVIQSSNYDKTVYGDDVVCIKTPEKAKSQNILVPVFGTVYNTGSALMGVITEGDGASSVSVVNGNSNSYYNTVYSKMKFRIYSQGTSLYKNNFTNLVSTVTHNDFDSDKYCVSYFLLSGEKANYSGMAEKYRGYLKEKYNLKPKNSKSSLSLDIYGAVTERTTTFGITHNKTYKLTAFDDAKELVKELYDSGVDSLSVRFIGWTGNGVYNSKIASKAIPLKLLGGKESFKSLADYIIGLGSEFYPVVDVVTYTKSGAGLSINNDSAKSPNGTKGLQRQYSSVTFEPLDDVDAWALIKPSLLDEVTQKFINSYKSLSIDSISFSEIGNYSYSDFSKKNGIYRTQSIKNIQEMLEETKKEVSEISVSGGNIYAAVCSDKVFDLPISSSGYAIFEYDVPFVQMVLNGYVDYTTPYFKQSADANDTFLKAVETGSDLLFACVGDNSYKISETRLENLYSSEFAMWKNDAIKYYSEINTVASVLDGATMLAHECLEEDLFKVTYSNATVIYINYSDSDKVIDGKSISAHGYLVGK